MWAWEKKNIKMNCLVWWLNLFWFRTAASAEPQFLFVVLRDLSPETALPTCLWGKSDNLQASTWFLRLKATGSWVLLTAGSDELLMWKRRADRTGASGRRFPLCNFWRKLRLSVARGNSWTWDRRICQNPARCHIGSRCDHTASSVWRQEGWRSQLTLSSLSLGTFYRSIEDLTGFVKFCIYISSWLKNDKSKLLNVIFKISWNFEFAFLCWLSPAKTRSSVILY